MYICAALLRDSPRRSRPKHVPSMNDERIGAKTAHMASTKAVARRIGMYGRRSVRDSQMSGAFSRLSAVHSTSPVKLSSSNLLGSKRKASLQPQARPRWSAASEPEEAAPATTAPSPSRPPDMLEVMCKPVGAKETTGPPPIEVRATLHAAPRAVAQVSVPVRAAPEL